MCNHGKCTAEQLCYQRGKQKATKDSLNCQVQICAAKVLIRLVAGIRIRKVVPSVKDPSRIYQHTSGIFVPII